MKIAWEVFMFCLLANLVAPLGYALQIAGTEYGYPMIGSGDTEDFEERFDPEGSLGDTDPSAWNVLTYLGNVGTSVITFLQNILFIFTGVYSLLMSAGAMIPDHAAYVAYERIVIVIQIVVYAIMGGYIVQLIVGRRVAV